MRKREKRRWERGNAEAEADEEDGRECMRQVSNQYRAMAMGGPFSGLQLAAPPAYTCVSSLHTRRSVSVHIFIIIIIIHMSFSRTEGPCSLEIHVARSHSVCRSLGLWIINSPSPAQLPYNFAITRTVCIEPLSPLCTPIAPSSSPWRARECNFPYFVRPARCSPNWPCFFIRMTPFCPPAFPLHLR